MKHHLLRHTFAALLALLVLSIVELVFYSVTGGRVEGRSLPMVKYLIEDKHGYQHEMFNLRAFVQREDVEPLEFGLAPEKLGDFPGKPALYEVPVLNDGPRMVQTAD